MGKWELVLLLLWQESCVSCVFDEVNMCSYKICVNNRGDFEFGIYTGLIQTRVRF